MNLLAAAVLAVALSACGVKAEDETAPAPIQIAAQPVPLDASHPSIDRAGDFAYAGGLWLTSPGSRLFGGFSDLKIDDGGNLVSESDEGSLLRAQIVLDADGRLVGLEKATIARLAGPDGKALSGKFESDAEGVMVWPDGDLSVSFERDHRIWTYPAGGGPPRPIPIPKVSMPTNEGMEGLALAPHEGADAYWVGVEAGSIWLCHVASGCKSWPGLMSPPQGYRLTALYETPAGDLAVLHHNYDPLTHRSRVLLSILALPRGPRDIAAIKAQLRLDPPRTVDNFEGVAATASPHGGLRFYLIVDDNFSKEQRTLLLAFDWRQPGRTTSASGGGRDR